MIEASHNDPLPVFSGIPTFCRLPLARVEDVPEGAAVVAGIAFDTTCTGRIGSRFGPRAVRETSQYFAADATVGATLVEVSTLRAMTFAPRAVYDVSDLRVYPSDPDLTIDAVTDQVGALIKRRVTPVIFGGDEYVAFPVAKGFAEGWASRGAAHVGYIHISGTLGMAGRHPLYGDHWDGAVARQIVDHGVVKLEHMALLGASGSCRASEWARVKNSESYVRTCYDMRASGLAKSVEDALRRCGADSAPVLVCLDMSVLDGAYAPGTSVPSYHGLTNSELLSVMDVLAAGNVAGLMITGVNPKVEETWTTQRLATVLALRFLANDFLRSPDPVREASK